MTAASPPGPAAGATIPAPRTGGYLSVVRREAKRAAPGAGGLARRRWLITTSKFLLPAAALALLSAIAVWPELDRVAERTHVMIQMGGAAIEGGRLTDARYHGVDEHGRPYTVTAATAAQRDADLIDLITPNADMTLENGSWMNVKSRLGVFDRKANQLDLSQEVVLYRDDGTTMTTDTATVEMKAGAASGASTTHVEGPFGTIDASGFTTVDKGAAIEFWGPVRVELNGVSK